MDRTEMKNKDVILHEEMTSEEREEELKRLKEESDSLT